MNTKIFALVAAGAMAVAALANDTSEPFLMFVDPDGSSFWRTAPSATFEVSIDFPDGATAATLAVTGTTYTAVYENIAAATYSLTLPAAATVKTEDVYELTLSFNDSAATVRTASIGLVSGQNGGASGTTRLISSSSQSLWTKAWGNNVVPVPYGMSALTVDGEPVVAGNKGFTGAPGWLAVGKLTGGDTVALELTTEDAAYAASLVGIGGLTLFLR